MKMRWARHALLRFTDEAGVELGQGIIPLHSLCLSEEPICGASEGQDLKLEKVETHIPGQAPAEGQTITSFSGETFLCKPPRGFCEVELSSGGTHRGTATLIVRISRSV